MSDPAATNPSGKVEHKLRIDVPRNAELWVGIEEREGHAPAIIVGGNPQGFLMLASLAKALAESGVPGARAELLAGDLLLEGSEADLHLAIHSETEAGSAP